MLGERDYIKGDVKKDFQLLKIFILIGVLVNLSVFISQGKLWIHLSLNLSELIDLKLWTPISSLFLAAHNGIISFIFDVLIFYYAGRRLEDYFGEQKLRQLFKWLLSTIIICLPILFLFFQTNYFYFFSCFMLGTVCTYSWNYFEVSTRFYVFFILPVDLKGKHILILIILYGLITAIQTPHLAILFSSIFLSSWLFFKEFHKKIKLKKENKKNIKLTSERTEIQKGFRRHVREDLADPEIDAILDKILAHGMESLSKEEKVILESRSEK
jgi:hypothetical protein